MTDVNGVKLCENSVKIESKRRKYCCICKNYRSKVVDDKIVTLHLFPANKSLQKASMNRIRTIKPKLQCKDHVDRLCSAHLINGVYDHNSKDNNVSTIFQLKDGRVERFQTTTVRLIICKYAIISVVFA